MATLNFTAQQPKFRKPSLLNHGNIPKPLHQLAPRLILGQEWWDVERQAAYAKNNYCCWACGIHKSQAKFHQWLEAHEIYKINWEKGRAVYKSSCALCHSCHAFIHSGRTQILCEQGEISQDRYDTIMRHGHELGSTTANRIPTKVQQDWSKWHLVIDGEKHYSKFRDLNHWRTHFGR